MTYSHTSSKHGVRDLCYYGNIMAMCVCVCVRVCPGGLFDDQFQEFGIRVRLRFKEREKKGQEERKRRAGRRGGAEERLRVS